MLMAKIITLLLFLAMNGLAVYNYQSDPDLALPKSGSTKEDKASAEGRVYALSALGGAAGTLVAIEVYQEEISIGNKAFPTSVMLCLMVNLLMYVLLLDLLSNFKELLR